MKFYVISIILTAVALFFPVAQKVAAVTEENTITVSLESIETTAEDAGNSSLEPPGGDGGSGGNPRTKEKQAVNQQAKIADNKKIKEIRKEASADNQKSSVSESVSDKTGKAPDSVLMSGNNGTEKGSENGGGNSSKAGTVSGDGNGTKTGTGAGNGSQSGKTYGCVKGKGYKMVSNPKIKLNRAQALTIPSGVRVTVSAAFSANGSLNISGVSGGNAEAQRLVRNAASGIRVNVIDKTITRCNVTIIYTLAE